MSRRVTLFLSILLICFCVSSVFAQESAGIVGDASTTATEPPAGSIPTTSATDNLKSNEQDYLYKKKVQNTVGVDLGEHAGLAVPTPVLVIVLAAFLGGVGFIVYKILDTENRREREKAEKKAAKDAKKGSRKNK